MSVAVAAGQNNAAADNAASILIRDQSLDSAGRNRLLMRQPSLRGDLGEDAGREDRQRQCRAD